MFASCIAYVKPVKEIVGIFPLILVTMLSAAKATHQTPETWQLDLPISLSFFRVIGFSPSFFTDLPQIGRKAFRKPHHWKILLLIY